MTVACIAVVDHITAETLWSRLEGLSILFTTLNNIFDNALILIVVNGRLCLNVIKQEQLTI